jgi:hypothetical protein
MKTKNIKYHIKNEIYYTLYPEYIKSFQILYKKYNIHENMLFYKIEKNKIPIIYNYIYKMSVFYKTPKEISENIDITIIGLSESIQNGIEYIIEIKDLNKNYSSLTNIEVSVIGKGNKIKWEKYYI